MTGRESTSGAQGGEGDRASDVQALFAELATSFRSLGDAGLASLGFPGRASSAEWQAALRGLAAWASLPSAHLDQIVREISGRRRRVQVLRDQLTAFDEQLATLEKTLRPLLEWNELWVGMQQSFLGAPGEWTFALLRLCPVAG